MRFMQLPCLSWGCICSFQSVLTREHVLRPICHRLHSILDVIFDEDASALRKDNDLQNLSLLKIVILKHFAAMRPTRARPACACSANALFGASAFGSGFLASRRYGMRLRRRWMDWGQNQTRRSAGSFVSGVELDCLNLATWWLNEGHKENTKLFRQANPLISWW